MTLIRGTPPCTPHMEVPPGLKNGRFSVKVEKGGLYADRLLANQTAGKPVRISCHGGKPVRISCHAGKPVRISCHQINNYIMEKTYCLHNFYMLWRQHIFQWIPMKANEKKQETPKLISFIYVTSSQEAFQKLINWASRPVFPGLFEFEAGTLYGTLQTVLRSIFKGKLEYKSFTSDTSYSKF